MKKILLSLICLAMAFSGLQAQMITEFHYDNSTSGDPGEFIEVVIPADGCDYTVEFYSGSTATNGTMYGMVAVPACTVSTPDICGTGVTGCITAIPYSGIQNGARDGFALVQNCAGTVTVIEFLSYEGTMTAGEGAAVGLTSVDVGVNETNSTPEGSSISLIDGAWEITPDATPGDCPPVSLAITLTNFDATSIDGAVMLEWSTENETNNDFFSIEHSVDGRDFTELNTIVGAGTSAEKLNYEYKHADAVSGINYYRLKQVDFDGRYSYTDVKSVDVKSTNTISVLPTLVSNEMKVRLSENLKDDAQINIYDITGQLVVETLMNRDNNNLDLNVSSLNSGTYFLILNIGGDIHSTKFMKL